MSPSSVVIQHTDYLSSPFPACPPRISPLFTSSLSSFHLLTPSLPRFIALAHSHSFQLHRFVRTHTNLFYNVPSTYALFTKHAY